MFLKKLINKGINKGYEATECELCHLQFNMLKLDRIHKCKRCLKFICNSCGDSKEHVIDDNGNRSTEKHRICKICKQDITLINDTIQKYRMRWEKDSTFAQEWLQNMKVVGRKDYQYQHFVNYFHKSGNKFIEEVEIIEKDVIRGRTDFSVFNYSMKEFFYTIQFNIQDMHTTRLNIANVLYAVAARFDKIGYCQGMSGISAFLLCFASEQTSYSIFCDLIQKMFPQKFFERNSAGVALIGLLGEIYFLKQYYWLFVQKKRQILLREMEEWYTEEEISHTKMVIQLAGSKSLLSIFIGVLNFSNLIFVWEELKNKRSFQVVEKAFLAIIYIHRRTILEERSFKKLEEYFQNVDSQIFQQTYHDIDIDLEAKKQLLERFQQQSQSKWSSSKSGNAYTLSKVTNLSEDEIVFLQKHFCPNFSNQDFVSRPIMDEEEFLHLIETYYKMLKENCEEGQQILEITPLVIRRLYKNYSTNSKHGLIFKQFICCFSICTKSNLRDRICAIVTSFEKSPNLVSYQNFSKVMKILMNQAPAKSQVLKIDFKERMSMFFAKRAVISFSELQVLLNDLFINEMGNYIRSDCEKILEMIVRENKIWKLQRQSKQEQCSYKNDIFTLS